MRNARGVTLIELIIIVAIMGMIAAAVSPSVMQQIIDERVEATRAEARSLYEGMAGRAGEGSSFGFVGDVGRLPQNFQELAQRGAIPAYSTNTVRSVGIGWRGPYVNVGTSADDYLYDAFGRAYTGASTGQVRSTGADGVSGSADDIVYPPAAPAIVGRVIATLKLTQGNAVLVDPNGYSVELYYANNGTQAVVTDVTSPFTFEDVPIGPHAIRVIKTTPPNAGAVVAQDTIAVRPGATTALELWF